MSAIAQLNDVNVKNMLAKTHKLLINNQWVESASGKTFEVYDPSSGAVIANVAAGNIILVAATLGIWRIVIAII